MALEQMRAASDVLEKLPLDQQLTLLLVTICRRRPQIMRSLISLITVMQMMTEGLSQSNRMMFGELLRDAADEIERAYQFERV